MISKVGTRAERVRLLVGVPPLRTPTSMRRSRTVVCRRRAGHSWPCLPAGRPEAAGSRRSNSATVPAAADLLDGRKAPKDRHRRVLVGTANHRHGWSARCPSAAAGSERRCVPHARRAGIRQRPGPVTTSVRTSAWSASSARLPEEWAAHNPPPGVAQRSPRRAHRQRDLQARAVLPHPVR